MSSRIALIVALINALIVTHVSSVFAKDQEIKPSTKDKSEIRKKGDVTIK